MSGLLPRVANEEAVFLLVSVLDEVVVLVGDAGLRDVALENQAKGLDTFLVGGGGTNGLVESGGGGGGG
jgi:hypothetical protein